MKSFFAFVLLFAFCFMGIASQAFAAPGSICPTGEFRPLCDLQVNKGSTIVSSIVIILLILAIVLALFFLIWGCIRWIMSGGDKSKIEAARTAIVSSIVGLILAFLAFFILNVIVFIFTNNTISNFKLPTIVP